MSVMGVALGSVGDARVCQNTDLYHAELQAAACDWIFTYHGEIELTHQVFLRNLGTTLDPTPQCYNSTLSALVEK